MEALSRTAPAHDGLMVMCSTSEVQCGGGDTCLSRRELPSLSPSFPFPSRSIISLVLSSRKSPTTLSESQIERQGIGSQTRTIRLKSSMFNAQDQHWFPNHAWL